MEGLVKTVQHKISMAIYNYKNKWEIANVQYKEALALSKVDMIEYRTFFLRRKKLISKLDNYRQNYIPFSYMFTTAYFLFTAYPDILSEKQYLLIDDDAQKKVYRQIKHLAECGDDIYLSPAQAQFVNEWSKI